MSHSPLRRILPLFLLLAVVTAGVIYLAGVSGADAGPLTASGTVNAVEVAVSPELTGRVVTVLAEQGDLVAAGDPLFQMDATLLEAQRQRASAAKETAQAALNVAQANLEAAQVQYALALNAARLQDLPARATEWSQVTPWEFTLPIWYFEKSEEITAAEAEVAAAEQALESGRANLQTVGGTDLEAAEERLVLALTAFQIAQDVLDRAQLARETQDLQDFAQEQLDAARTELEDAQTAYDDLLSEESAADVLRARAQVAIAQARYGAAQDRLSQFQSGDFSLQVRAAQAVVGQAEAALEQAQAAVGQMEAEISSIDVQLAKLTVRAPATGVVITRSLEPGEVVLAGGVVMTVGRLDRLTITVYLPEDRYGQISLEGEATVTVDSFPGETFRATVTRIAQRAEFTPRNVQTKEGRQTTVFAVELSVSDPAGKLKPGMPADVVFELP